jgi:hypothetical protein
VPYAATKLNLILFKFHARAAAVAKSSPGQCVLDIASGDFNASGHTFNDRNELRAVRFSSG